MTDINDLLNFVKFTHDIRRVKRAILLEGTSQENDAEHSYQMALVAWYIIENDKLKLDIYRCIAMAMVHDVIEVYAGDTVAFAPKKELAAKLLREAKAVKEFKLSWPNLPLLHELVSEYEERQTPESKFIYALDKLLPEINNYLFEGKVWKKLGISLEQVKEIKKGKVDINETISNYHRQILKIIEQEPELFVKGEL